MQRLSNKTLKIMIDEFVLIILLSFFIYFTYNYASIKCAVTLKVKVNYNNLSQYLNITDYTNHR